MEIYRSTSEGGYYKYVAIWDQEADTLVWNVETQHGEVVHVGDNCDNLVQLIRDIVGDYTLLDALELATAILKEAMESLDFEIMCIDNDRLDYSEEAQDERENGRVA